MASSRLICWDTHDDSVRIPLPLYSVFRLAQLSGKIIIDIWVIDIQIFGVKGRFFDMMEKDAQTLHLAEAVPCMEPPYHHYRHHYHHPTITHIVTLLVINPNLGA